jgi:hypothetical protein
MPMAITELAWALTSFTIEIWGDTEKKKKQEI